MRHDLLDANPMDRIGTVKVPKRLPRPAAAGDVEKVLAAICPRRPRKDLPVDRVRDRVLFETIYVCGARAGEVCGLYVEDLDLRSYLAGTDLRLEDDSVASRVDEPALVGQDDQLSPVTGV